MNQPKIVAGGGKTSDALTEKEQRILEGHPVARIPCPGWDEPIPIWPKPQAYFYLIMDAVRRYLDALATYDLGVGVMRPEYHKRWWQTKARAVRAYEKRVDAWEERRLEWLDSVGREKHRLLRLILEDRYHPERNVKLDDHLFLAMPHDVVVRIVDAYQEANDVEDILKRLIPGYGKGEKKSLKPDLPAASMRT